MLFEKIFVTFIFFSEQIEQIQKSNHKKMQKEANLVFIVTTDVHFFEKKIVNMFTKIVNIKWEKTEMLQFFCIY